MTFVRTDASREITLVSPLAASGRRLRTLTAASAPAPWRRTDGRAGGRCLQSRHVALLTGRSTTVNRRLSRREHQHQRQQHYQRRPHLGRVCFTMIYACIRSSSRLLYVLHRHVFGNKFARFVIVLAISFDVSFLYLCLRRNFAKKESTHKSSNSIKRLVQ